MSRRIGSDCHLPDGQECRCKRDIGEDREYDRTKYLMGLGWSAALWGILAIVSMVCVAAWQMFTQGYLTWEIYRDILGMWCIVVLSMVFVLGHDRDRNLREKQLRCAVDDLLRERDNSPRVTQYQLDLLKNEIKHLESVVDGILYTDRDAG